MKKYFLIILFNTLLYLSCNKINNNNDLIYFKPTTDTITLNKQVDSILKVFINENQKKDCNYFLVAYIAGSRVITLIANNMGDGYIKNKNTLFYFTLSNKKIYLITGSEFLFDINFSQIKINKNKERYFITKSYIFEGDKLKLLPNYIPLFAPPPTPPIDTLVTYNSDH